MHHPQRTRHASLDFPRPNNNRLSPHDEWTEFLSASMLALTTEDDEETTDVTSRSLTSLPTLTSRHADNQMSSSTTDLMKLRDDSVFGNSTLGGKQRRDSMSDSMTSSSGSSPAAGSTWRPLGRRASTHLVTSNQSEHQFDASPFAQTNATANDPLKHTSSFREVVSSALSSSGSSLVESLSSDEETTDSNNNEFSASELVRPGIIDVDPEYAASCLPVLTNLPSDPRSLSVDTRASPIMHAKSPVLSNRKDSATWQLQEEEMLTSPRFGGFRASLDESMFGNALGDESNNQLLDDIASPPRVTKDVRAASVDFTFSRPSEQLNPPLPPPPQEPLQRLRARSFSYSAAYGPSSYNSGFTNNKPYLAHHPSPLEFPTTMRQFHSAGPPPPPPPQMSQSIRPPRVNIPSDAPMPPYHQAAQPPFRRYSTDFTMLPFQEQHQRELEANTMQMQQAQQSQHRTPTGRGIRSYSVEYTNYATNSRVRSQSMEGSQYFSPNGPPMEFMTTPRHASGGMTYEWPRSPISGPPTGPPLPPNMRTSMAMNQFSPPQPPPEAYYEIEFKRGRTEVFAGNAGYNVGEYVKVEADRGEDIGKVARRIADPSKLQATASNNDGANLNEDPLGRGSKRHDLPVKKVMCVASPRECEQLNEQRKEEHEVFEVCKSKVRQRLLPMNVIDAEYQFDRHKLTFFFEADRRIDFRELVRDLFAIYKTRIWLQQVVPNNGKKPTLSNEYEDHH